MSELLKRPLSTLTSLGLGGMLELEGHIGAVAHLILKKLMIKHSDDHKCSFFSPHFLSLSPHSTHSVKQNGFI